MIDRLEKLVFNTSRRLNYISGVALTIMMALVFINVIFRAIWRPILGTYEFTAFLASLTISFSLAKCATDKGHVAITLFVDRLSRRSQAVFDIIVGGIGTVLFAVLSWQSAKYAVVIYHSGEVALTTELPFYPFIFGVAFGFAMLAAVNLIDFMNSLKKAIKK